MSRFGEGQTPAPSWQTVIEVDWSAQPNTALNVDGVYLIAGRNWTVENSANTFAGHVGMRIVAGDGLQLPCQNIVGNYYHLNRLAPLIRTALPASIDSDTPIRVAMQIGVTSNATPNVDFGVEYPVLANWHAIYGLATMIAPGGTFASWGGGSVVAAVNDAYAAANTRAIPNGDILGVHLPLGCLPGAPAAFEMGSSVAGDWAAPSLSRVWWYNRAGSPANVNTTSAALNPANWAAVLSARWASLGQYYQTIRRFRVQIYG